VKLVETVAELQEELNNQRNSGKKITFIPTMGALHSGHLSLVDLANLDDFVVMSIFVNPTQFGKGEDFDKYPRGLEKDLELLAQQGKVDLVFAPLVSEVYPDGLPQTLVPRAGAVGSVFEGVSRPGHFDGMLHVVNWFFNTVKPNTAIFGAKDAQQLFLIKRMVQREFESKIQIVEAPTSREADGLARSSRNVYLSEIARANANQIYKALVAVASRIQSGIELATALDEGRLALSSIPLAKLDYLGLVDKRTFAPISQGFTGEALLLVAVVLDGVRLIDNLSVEI